MNSYKLVGFSVETTIVESGSTTIMRVNPDVPLDALDPETRAFCESVWTPALVAEYRLLNPELPAYDFSAAAAAEKIKVIKAEIGDIENSMNRSIRELLLTPSDVTARTLLRNADDKIAALRLKLGSL